MKLARYWIPVLLSFAAIHYLSSLPQSELPSLDFPFIDKLAHFFVYTVLGLVVARALTATHRYHVSWTEFRKFIAISILIVCLYGALDEVHQSQTPGRFVELGDFLADCLGGILGSFLVIPYRRWVLGIERS